MHKQNIYFVLELLINRKLDLKKEYTQIAKLAKSTYYINVLHIMLVEL